MAAVCHPENHRLIAAAIDILLEHHFWDPRVAIGRHYALALLQAYWRSASEAEIEIVLDVEEFFPRDSAQAFLAYCAARRSESA